MEIIKHAPKIENKYNLPLEIEVLNKFSFFAMIKS